MTRAAIPYAAADISALAKFLRDQLSARATPPGHVEMLNLLARAAGARNFQHFRAMAGPAPALPAQPAADMKRVEKVARLFDANGRLLSWPAKSTHQALALWAFWAAIPPGESFSEQGFSAWLSARHSFGDSAILRRSMVGAELVSRTTDGRDYRRIEQRPTPDALALIAALKARI